MERANREMEKRGEKREGVPVVILLVPWMKYRLAVSGLLPPFLSSSSEFLLLLLLRFSFILFLVRFNYSPSNVSLLQHSLTSTPSPLNVKRYAMFVLDDSNPYSVFFLFFGSTSSGLRSRPAHVSLPYIGNTTGPSITFYQRG